MRCDKWREYDHFAKCCPTSNEERGDRLVYKKTESSDMINTNALKQEIEQKQELSKLDDTSGDINIELIVNNVEKKQSSQMEQWSILSSAINYVQYDKHPKNFHNLNISTVNKVNSKRNSNIEEKHRHELDLDFGDTPEKLEEECLDIYEGIPSEILRFVENSNLSMTYLGMVDMIKNSRIKAEESFQISEQGYTMGKLLDRTECQVLFDTIASKSLMSKSPYLHCRSFHSLPKFASRTQII